MPVKISIDSTDYEVTSENIKISSYSFILVIVEYKT